MKQRTHEAKAATRQASKASRVCHCLGLGFRVYGLGLEFALADVPLLDGLAKLNNFIVASSTHPNNIPCSEQRHTVQQSWVSNW